MKYPKIEDFLDAGSYCGALEDYIAYLGAAGHDTVEKLRDERDQAQVDQRKAVAELEVSRAARLELAEENVAWIHEVSALREKCVELAEDLPRLLVHFVRWQKEQHNARFVDGRGERVPVGTADAEAFCSAHGYVRESGVLEPEDSGADVEKPEDPPANRAPY